MRSSDSPTVSRHTTIDIIVPGSRNVIGSERPLAFLAHKPRENFEDQIAITISRFVKNYATIISMLYLFICFQGVIYDDAVYVKTGVNPLLYFDVSDFLLSGLRHPIIFLIPTILTVAIIVLGTMLGLHDTRAYYAISAVLLFCIAGLISVHAANYKMEYCGQDVWIEFNEKSASPTSQSKWMIYGSTNKVVFVEPREDSKTPDNIVNGAVPNKIKQIEAVPFETIKEIKFNNTRYGFRRDLQCKILYQ
jgi:hypothetical protein